ncbi:ATP-dependent metallopeptidase FtsH/Yme1/Tma family protein [Peribacillus sp. NPDC096540]|uniref:ATP-dependent metallopeptidase FtsH/Yme1/Tma family protein n=1 Tax=Peribacillus sp. NPDC096540 TaxID=3390612 RepID=UPI003D016C66
MNRNFRNTIFYLLIFLVIIGIVIIFNNNNESTEKMTQDEFYNHLESGDVTSLTMQPESSEFKIIWKLKGDAENKNFVTYVPFSEHSQSRINDAVTKLGKDIITVEPREKTSGWVTFFTSIIPFVIIFILFFFIFLFVAVRKKWKG